VRAPVRALLPRVPEPQVREQGQALGPGQGPGQELLPRALLAQVLVLASAQGPEQVQVLLPRALPAQALGLELVSGQGREREPGQSLGQGQGLPEEHNH
jgi:hypothetical protein